MKVDTKYEPKKEKREWYFVEYHPANYFKFASLNLVLINENAVDNEIKIAMEMEAKYWLIRYPIPVFVSIFNNQGVLYKFSETNETSHLTAFFDQNGEIYVSWELLKDKDIPDIAFDEEYRKKLYSDFDFKTYAQLDTEKDKRRHQIENGRLIILFWIFITAVVWEAFVYFSDFLSLVAFIAVLGKAIHTVLGYVNLLPKSKRAKEKELEQTLKDHYYYHCKMNPEGFDRLKRENFEKMAKEDVKRELNSFEK